MALDSQEQKLQAGLRRNSSLLFAAIRARGSGRLSGRTSCKHEKPSRGVAAQETPREAGDRARSCLILGNSMGYCAPSPMLPLIFHKLT